MDLSRDYIDGYTRALVDVSDMFETRSDAFLKRRLLRKKDTRFICAVIDAMIRRRETLMDVGIKKMQLFLRQDGTVELKEK